MLCNVCKEGLEGLWDPSRSRRLALVKDYLEPDDEDEGGDDEPGDAQDSGATGTDIPSQNGAFDYVYGHHKDRDSFLASMQEGCAMCNRFTPGQAPGDGDNPKIQELGYFSIFYIRVDPEAAVTKPVMMVDVENSRGGFDFVPYGDPKYDQNINFDFGPSNHDPKAWSVAEKWMSTCLNSHSRCKLTEAPTSYRPTRLLKIDTPGSFRIVLGTDCPPALQYVTLSHCWGAKPVERLLRLLKSTAKDLGREQSVNNLPKTFRDAVDIARHFGVDYLWIDRLCIFQDSAEEWRREAATMQDVYRNALFSIAALGAKDDEGGCFFERDPAKTAPTVVRFKLTEDGEEETFRFGLEEGWSWRLSFEDEPLVQRSWVVQERLLSPRTLHFGSKQLFWECREMACCETHPQSVYCYRDYDDEEDEVEGAENIEEPDQESHYPCLWKQLLDAPDRRHGRNPYEQLFIDWNMIANLYASRKLSLPGDKLVALSGLANSMKARLQQLRPGPHRYLAGLWEETLMDTLVWNVRSPAIRAPQYRAPSWSWACLDGNLNLLGGCTQEEEGKDTISLTSLISVEMSHPGEEDTGQVTAGTLILEGPCGRAAIGKETWSAETELNILSIGGEDGRIFREKDMVRANVYFDTLDDITDQVSLVWVCAHHFDEGEWYVHGLALGRVEENTYRRLGMASCSFKDKESTEAFGAAFPRKDVKIV